MTVLHFARKLYSLDTLDTRFTTSSKSPLGATPSQVDPAKPSSKEDRSDNVAGGVFDSSGQNNGPPPSRWRTAEYYVYYLIITISLIQMFKVAFDVSKPSHPSYHQYAHLLSPGWIPGRKVDNSDDQYSMIRDNVPYMFILLILHPLLRRAYESVLLLQKRTPVSSAEPKSNGHLSRSLVTSTADSRLNQRVTFDLYFSLVFIAALHSFSALKVFLILYANFTFATRLPRSYVPAFTWTFNIGILFANEIFNGYPFAALAASIIPPTISNNPEAGLGIQNDWVSKLDSYGGLISRWEILFNITVLRLISFNLDYCWSLDRGGASPVEKKQLDPSNLSERDRVDLPAKTEDYSFRNYLTYALYAPLYLTGPIITFNDYISQLRYPPKSITLSRTLLYGARFLICFLTMEVMMHFVYAVAICKASPAWEIYSPFQLSMLGYFNLHHIWLKLLLPWRFFRLWALLDGIDPPENMVRCMSDNYSALAFWRGWHRSFNRWIIRYIYIPLGGSGITGNWGKARAAINYLAVFTFVALWHDISLRLLAWGWLISLFILPEVLAGFLFPKRNWQNHRNAYRVICGIGATANILMMMAANLVGFAVGLNGLKGLVHGIVGSYSGLVFMVTACAALFTGVQVMFELREHELRHGIKMKC